MTTPHQNSIKALAALSIMDAILKTSTKPHPKASESPFPSLDEMQEHLNQLGSMDAPAPQAERPDDSILDELIGAIFGTAKPAPVRICQSTSIPQDIADAAGMQADSFDARSLAGRTVALLAAAQANLRLLSQVSASPERDKCEIAGYQIATAITTVHRVTPKQEPQGAQHV